MKQLTQIKPAPHPHWVGDGFPVRSLVSIEGDARQTSPFLMLDYASPHEFAPASAPRGVGGHPHRGFETVTIAYQGEIAHRDSSGNHGLIRPGHVQWMTAASVCCMMSSIPKNLRAWAARSKWCNFGSTCLRATR